MTSRWLAFTLAALGSFPAAARAHLDVIYAKLQFLPGGRARLVQLLDYTENPAAPDEAAARDLLITGLGLDRGKGPEPAAQVLGPPEFSTTAQLDPTTPPAYRFAEEHKTARRLAQAVWSFPADRPLCFAMPASFPLDVVLWTEPSNGDMSKAAQFYLAPGDSTFHIPPEAAAYELPAHRHGPRLAAWAMVGALVALLGAIGLRAKLRR